MSTNITKLRLDQALVARGLARTRSQARDLIERGCVTVDEEPAFKAGMSIGLSRVVRVRDGTASYVSRGAVKLAAALDHFKFPVRHKVVLDAGASTGGFTQVLLARGAERVYAVDVGHGQLDDSLSIDPRVIALERCDVRSLDRRRIPQSLDALVADLSFISLTKALPAALKLSAERAWLIVLVKPQFEVGPTGIGKGGIVRDPAVRRSAVTRVSEWLNGQGRWRVVDVIGSPIRGGSGNEEFLLGAVRGV